MTARMIDRITPRFPVPAWALAKPVLPPTTRALVDWINRLSDRVRELQHELAVLELKLAALRTVPKESEQ